MTNGLPCPNPACKHVFAVAQVQGATVLTCPRCARVFHFLAGQGGSPSVLKPVPAPLATPTMAVPANGAATLPSALATPAATGIVPPEILQRHRQQVSQRWLSVVVASLIGVSALGMVVGGYVTFRISPKEEKRPETGRRFSADPGPSRSAPPTRSVAAAPLPSENTRAPSPAQPVHPPEQANPVENFRGDRTELELPAGVWTKFKASDEDEQGDLFLQGRAPQDPDNTKGATVMIVVLDKSAGDSASATKMVRERLEMQQQVQNKEFRLASAAEREPPESEAVGGRRGRVLEFKELIGEEPRKYLLLAVVPLAEATYAIRCECAWAQRQVWQGAFRELLKSFRVSGKE